MIPLTPTAYSHLKVEVHDMETEHQAYVYIVGKGTPVTNSLLKKHPNIY